MSNCHFLARGHNASKFLRYLRMHRRSGELEPSGVQTARGSGSGCTHATVVSKWCHRKLDRVSGCADADIRSAREVSSCGLASSGRRDARYWWRTLAGRSDAQGAAPSCDVWPDADFGGDTSRSAPRLPFAADLARDATASPIPRAAAAADASTEFGGGRKRAASAASGSPTVLC